MNLTALIQQQSLAALLAAIESAPVLKGGETVQARLLSINPEGVARAMIAGSAIDLVLAGATARQASVVPGAILQLRIDLPSSSGQAARATLLNVTAASAGAALSDAALANTGRNPQDIMSLPASASPAPASARALAGPMLAQAATRQDSLAPLFATVSALPNMQVDALSGPVLASAARLLAQRLPGEGAPITARELRQAVAGSGLFHEAQLAAGNGQAAQGDLKTTLLALKSALQALVPRAGADASTADPQAPSRPPLSRHDGQPGAQGMAQVALPADVSAAQSLLRATLLALKSAQHMPGPPGSADETSTDLQAPLRNPAALPAALLASASRPPLPRHDGQPVAQGIAQVALPADASAAQVHKLLSQQTDAALDRLSLSQYASLPPAQDVARTDASAAQRWFAEVPLALAQGTAVLPFEIERDPPKPGSRPGDMPVWRVRFALDGEPLGPLHALVTMQGKAVNVSVWALREDTSHILREAAPGLRDALTHETFERAELEIFTGSPAQPKAAAGQFLDRRS